MSRNNIALEMEKFIQTLAVIRELKEQEKWEQAIEIIGANLYRLLKIHPNEFRKLTETGLLAQLIKHSPAATIWVPYKKIMLIALLKETGDYATVKHPPPGGFGWYLKALHLLLDALAHEELREYSDVAPKMEELLQALSNLSIPVRTRLLIMREYERNGRFRKVRDQFLAALEKTPKNLTLINIGIACFERFNRETDATLVAGGWSRSELEALLNELTMSKSVFCRE